MGYVPEARSLVSTGPIGLLSALSVLWKWATVVPHLISFFSAGIRARRRRGQQGFRDDDIHRPVRGPLQERVDVGGVVAFRIGNVLGFVLIDAGGGGGRQEVSVALVAALTPVHDRRTSSWPVFSFTKASAFLETWKKTGTTCSAPCRPARCRAHPRRHRQPTSSLPFSPRQ